MILVIDNYDSFTYNLVQLFSTGEEVLVRRNDELSVARIAGLAPSLIVISPGPGRPEDAGVCLEVAERLSGRIPILGVCLGHQCIAQAFGATVRRAERIVHGSTSRVYHVGRGLFNGLPNPFVAARYHSLIVDDDALPPELEVTAHTSDGEIMGIAVRGTAVQGVQFHPESFMTHGGAELAANMLRLARAEVCV